MLSSNSNNCCLLYFNANIMCSFTKKLQLLGNFVPQIPYWGSAPGPPRGTFFFVSSIIFSVYGTVWWIKLTSQMLSTHKYIVIVSYCARWALLCLHLFEFCWMSLQLLLLSVGTAFVSNWWLGDTSTDSRLCGNVSCMCLHNEMLEYTDKVAVMKVGGEKSKINWSSQ